MVGDSLIDYGRWNEIFPTKEIVNHGISGDTTAGVLNRVDIVCSSNPSKVFIMIGINDLLREENFDDFFDNYQNIVNILIEKNIKVYLQSILLIGKNYKNSNVRISNINTNVAKLNNLLKDYARTNELITYIELNHVLSNGSFLIEEYSIDSLHLNRKGYNIWEDIIRQYII